MSVASLSNQTVTIYPAGARDRTNKVTWGTGVDFSCRLTKTSKVIATQEKDREPIDALAIINGEPDVSIGDKAVYGDDTFRIILVKEAIGGNGAVHHVTLMLQRWKTG